MEKAVKMAAMRRERLAGGCTAALALGATVCLSTALLTWGWVNVPALRGQTDRVYACVGVKLDGPIRFGYGWAANLSGLTPLYVSLPLTACGYYPRPPFLAYFGIHLFQL